MTEAFSRIESANLESARAVFISCLQSYLGELQKGDYLTAAYDIAGLMATRYAKSLTYDDPIDEILTIAGELEVNPPNHDDLRRELIQKIKAL